MTTPRAETPPDDGPPPDDGAPEPGRERWLVLLLMGFALCVVVLNNSSLNVAIPELMRDLDADLPTVQWIVDSYSIVFAGLLIVAGAWSDRWGRKRMTLGGLAVFGVASALAVLATEAWHVVLVRAVLGAAAAFVMPGTLAILLHAFPRRERARAIALWTGIAVLGVALGPVLGGLVVTTAGWSGVFWLNVPPAAAVVLAGVFLVRESADPQRRPTDALGAMLSVVAVGALVFTVIEAGQHGGLHVRTGVGAAVTLAAGVAFVRRLRRTPFPLVELALLRRERFRGAALGNMLLFFGLAGTLFVLTQRLQVQLGMSPLAAGLAVGPIALTAFAASACSPLVARRLGPRTTVTGGLLLVAAGIAVVGWWGGSYQVIAPALVAVGVGFGAATPVATDLLVSTLSDDRASSGSALNDTMQETGFALGIAAVGAVLNRVFVQALDGPGTLQQARAVAEELPARAGAALVDRADAAFDDAARAALTVAAVVTALGAAVAFRLLAGGREPAPGQAPAEPEDTFGPPHVAGEPAPDRSPALTADERGR
ncbi:MFS transporter [Streptomyces alkaliterrae]|uniref:MFS transporter n=1 Tax=Streptomyces alkaliterrae TaxID=2213162 RepID=A0A5P0YRK9_9ACTN|nr:MFS transporter [Streptomyces alkaliterrae]MBB1259102.1 MFS transporter [Streptomyces alkaliterrae]MQS02247.1 MFS transporter [Streptomyces alkaliterrae]